MQVLRILQNGTLHMSEEKKIKVLVMADHPLAPSGVGIQTKYIIETLLKTGRYKFVCLGAAMQHESYSVQKVEDYGDDWTIYPVDGYGSQEIVRSMMWQEKPDIIWFMTDPRFYGWLWDMENEIRPLAPMVYYHVWDNYPYPIFNKNFYESTDVIASISKLTYDVVNNVAPDVENHYIPHAVNTDIFIPFDKETIEEHKKEHFPDFPPEKFIFLWNNRNARRKMSGSLVYWFNEFAEEVGPENVCLIMHTDPKDPHGTDLSYMINELNADDGRIMLSVNKMPIEGLSVLYNMADCTINIADAEGFGLATLESLSCGTPIIVNMTGGLQEQVTDGEEWFGIGIEPASKALIGSQEVPYIYEDRISKEDFKAALHKMYNTSKEDRIKMGHAGRGHIAKNYLFKDYQNRWIELMDSVYEKYGSWENKKGYEAWKLMEIK